MDFAYNHFYYVATNILKIPQQFIFDENIVVQQISKTDFFGFICDNYNNKVHIGIFSLIDKK
jgi:hypothetical protein